MEIGCQLHGSPWSVPPCLRTARSQVHFCLLGHLVQGLYGRMVEGDCCDASMGAHNIRSASGTSKLSMACQGLRAMIWHAKAGLQAV